MKIYIKEIAEGTFNAGFKARADVDAFLEKKGFSPLNITIFGPSTSAIAKKVRRLTETVSLRKSLAGNGELFLQYPLYTYRGKSRLLSFLLGRHKGPMTILVHDIPGYRSGGAIDAELRMLLQRKPTVIAHTPAMAARIEADAGCAPGTIKVLNLFDYLTSDPAGEPTPEGRAVIFAGNLKECGFLRRLDEIKGLKFNIYGIRSEHVRESDTCRYCGKFSPEEVSKIKGDWGLVWHGPDLETSAGNIGEYLRIIASHKISLYLAAGKPVILWDESSVAQYILDNHLGIAVKSMLDIPAALDALTPEQIELIKTSVKNFSSKLRRSEMLGSIIK